MNYLTVILSGATDDPLPELDDRTPLMVASSQGEHLKAMARRSRVGLVRALPEDWGGDPEAALVALLGFDPAEDFTGRGPLEAADLQIEMDRADIAFRANFVHTDGRSLLDPTAGVIGKEEGRELLRHVQETLRIRTMQFYPGSGSRHVMIWRDGPDGLRCASPHDAQGKSLREHFPTGDRAERLIPILWDTAEVLEGHRINRRRRDEGKPTADMLWPWSPGRRPHPQSFGLKHGIGGACVAGSEMVRGFARLVGLRVVEVPGATGSLDTDYAAKARASLKALDEFNFCLTHLAAPNVAGLNGDWEAKVDVLRRIDDRFFGTILDRIGVLDDFRILVLIDHPTPVGARKAVPNWTPFMLTGNKEKLQTQGIVPFDERALDDASWRLDRPAELLPQLFDLAP